MTEFFVMSKQRKARKTYKCDTGHCGKTINHGDVYEIIKSLENGKWETFRYCLACIKESDQAVADMKYYRGADE